MSKSKEVSPAVVRETILDLQRGVELPSTTPFPIVLRTAKVLDGPRRQRQLERRVEVLKSRQARASKLTAAQKALTDHLAAQQAYGELKLGLTSKRVAALKRWCARVPADSLVFFAQSLPMGPWRDLANLLHLAPSDFTLPWFLPFAFGAPATAALEAIRTLRAALPAERLRTLADGKVPYSTLRRLPEPTATAAAPEITASADAPERRKPSRAMRWRRGKRVPVKAMREWRKAHRKPAVRLGKVGRKGARAAQAEAWLSAEEKLCVAGYESLATLLWFMEELRTADVDRVIAHRLAAGEAVALPCAKLLERLLRLRGEAPKFFADLQRAADAQLEELALHGDVESPVVVMGDASGSMGVAVETSTIIASMLCVLTQADLVFFNSHEIRPPVVPLRVADILQVVEHVRAEGSTANAAALYPYYRDRKVVQTFIMVTDEEENATAPNGDRFLALYRRYREEINPEARLVFVSFLDAPERTRGSMCTELDNEEIPVIQFKVNKHEPDLTKMDRLLAILAGQ